MQLALEHPEVDHLAFHFLEQREPMARLQQPALLVRAHLRPLAHVPELVQRPREQRARANVHLVRVRVRARARVGVRLKVRVRVRVRVRDGVRVRARARVCGAP